MQKFIHDDFELDLSNYRIDRVEENQWFSDEFFTKYTFPFELKLTDEINRFFGAITDFNVESPRTLYKGYFFVDGKHEEAVLEIFETLGKVAQVEISYGLDEFPNWDKQLSELPLEVVSLPESLFDHAEDIIVQSYPDVNYNFPRVFTDSFDAEEDRWLGFEGAINNYANGAFILNEFDAVENLTFNRNIMIPMPYLMHVLQSGFSDAGYTLKGDILTDTDIQKMLLYREADEYISARIEGDEVVLGTIDFVEQYQQLYTFGAFSLSSITTTIGRYETEYAFPARGRYVISGNVFLRRDDSEALAQIFYKGNRVWKTYEGLLRAGFSEKVKYVDLVIDVEDLSEKLIFESTQITYGYERDTVNKELSLLDLTITPIAIYDNQNELIPALVTSSKVDLTKSVPTTTFGDTVKAVKNWKNMELRIDGKDVYMNYIEPQLNVTDAKDFSAFNLQKPRRKFSQGDSFLLMFKELENENYNPDTVYVDIDGVQTSGFVKTDKTTEIEIDAILFPLVFRNGFTSALAVDDGDSNLCVVMYEGVTGISNVAQDISAVQLPQIYEAHWSNWLNFRLTSQGFTTSFNCYTHKLRGLTTGDKLFMYNNYHLIRTLNKANIPGTDTVDVELELEKLK